MGYSSFDNWWFNSLTDQSTNLEEFLAFGKVLNHTDKESNPIFEQYSYIIDFDSKQFKYYEGS